MMRLLTVFLPGSVVALLVSEIVLAYTCYVIACFVVLDLDPVTFLLQGNGFVRIGVVVVCLAGGIYLHDLYSTLRIRLRLLLFQQLSVVVGFAFLIQALLAYMQFRELTLPAWVMILGSLLAVVSLAAWRILFSHIVLKAMGSERVLFLGVSPLARQVAAQMVEHPEAGFSPLGFVDDSTTNEHGLRILGNSAHLPRIVHELSPDRVVLAEPDPRRTLPVNLLMEIRVSGVQIEDVLTTYETLFGRVSHELRPSQLIFPMELGPHPHRVMLQSVYSLVLALVAAVVTAPIALAIAILVKLTSPGPALTSENRVGLHDTLFRLYRFRTTVGPDPGAPVTPLGFWLRRFRLVELPQLLNVLKGDMSLVGPLPERPEFVAELQRHVPFYRQRHCVKPGITGWAQINLRNRNEVPDTLARLEYDLYYIKNLAPALDAFILFYAAKATLQPRLTPVAAGEEVSYHSVR